MPIVSSQITEDSRQADGRRWITEKHTDSVGKAYQVKYLAESDTDVNVVMSARVSAMDQMLIDTEIAVYLDRIENGLDVIGETYIETVQADRALRFLEWAKELIRNNTLEPLRYAWKVTEPFTETQINNLLSGTAFANKADKIKLWETRLKAMDVEMLAASVAAGEV